MLAHEGSFVLATLINLAIFILEKIGENIDDKNQSYWRLKIAVNCLNIPGYFAWFSVNVLMLRIFIKYRKPLEDNDEVYI